MVQHKDAANWIGVKFKSVDVGVKSKRGFKYKGYLYATSGEKKIAEMLDKQGIEFTPDVRINLTKGNKKAHSNSVSAFLPDFVFNGKAYIWTDPETGTEELIHGIEDKRTDTKYSKARKLYRLRSINIKILNAEMIDSFYKQGDLPIHLLEEGQ